MSGTEKESWSGDRGLGIMLAVWFNILMWHGGSVVWVQCNGVVKVMYFGVGVWLLEWGYEGHIAPSAIEVAYHTKSC